jgi:hypothetical protein
MIRRLKPKSNEYFENLADIVTNLNQALAAPLPKRGTRAKGDTTEGQNQPT